MATNDRLTVQQSAIVWRCNKVDGEVSPVFEIQQKQFQLLFFSCWREESDYRLRLNNVNCPPEPFYVSVYLIIGEDSVSHCTATVQNKVSNLLWKTTKSDLLKIVPDFEEKPFRFILVLLEKNTEHKSVQTPIYFDPKFQLEKLSVDLVKLLDGDNSNSDVEVVCGERTLKAHRSLLSCRSDVFKAMLQSDMLEGKTGRVQVRDTEADIFGQFLYHLYTGELPELSVDSAMRFYEIGDQYSVVGIKEMCASFLTDNLTQDNACAILSLAERHSDLEFRQSVVSYVLNKKIPLYKEYWSDFCNDHPRLANEILNQFVHLHISK